jgi:hypothetical protein
MSLERPDADDLARIAAAATDEVRAAAKAAGQLLPVWRDNRVVFVDPTTGEVVETQQRSDAAPPHNPAMPAVTRFMA